MTTKDYGPSSANAQDIHKMKYRQEGETFEAAMARIAMALAPGDERFLDSLLNQRFLPGGRIQAGAGASKAVTLLNCFVAPTIEDSMNGIMDTVKFAAETMRRGGGIGYDFSTLRPAGDLVKSLNSTASGPLSFMDVFDAACKTISSSGHRRGAQMAVLRVDHPDILEFVKAKGNQERLRTFNMSVGITDEFMTCLIENEDFELKFEGKHHSWINPNLIWDAIMKMTWDWAEPGVVFIDRINRENNLWNLENIAATNP